MGYILFLAALGAIGYVIYRGFMSEYTGGAAGPDHKPPHSNRNTDDEAGTDWDGRDDPDEPPEDEDNWEGAFYDVQLPRSIQRSVQIDYTDGQGQNTTKRRVDIRGYEPGNPRGLVIGHCHLRNETRTFRFDRIRKAVDAQTGEILPGLQQALDEQWQASPASAIDALYKQHGDVLRMLLYVARADGSMRTKEREVIAELLRELTDEARITGDSVIEMMGFVDHPTQRAFTIIYNRMRREKPELAERTANACRAIVATEKTIHTNEAAALAILDKPLPKR